MPGFADNGTRQVVIGHDARYNSEKFARLAAAAFMAKGFGILWFERSVHTPMVSYCHYSIRFRIESLLGPVRGQVLQCRSWDNDNGFT
jgi:hypothetical protein